MVESALSWRELRTTMAPSGRITVPSPRPMRLPPQGYQQRDALLAPAIGVVLAFFAGPVSAHPEIEDQIRNLTERVEDLRGEACAELFLQRGELYRVHRDWDFALADFERALTFDASLSVVRFCRGRLFLERGEARRALEELDAFLESVPGDSRGLALRARAYQDLGKYGEADAAYAAAVTSSERPSPQLILEWAECRLASDVKGKGKESALAALDRGIGCLGPLVTLQTRAIELECGRGNFGAALERIEATMAANGVTPLWLRQKAEILVESGRPAEGVCVYREALARLDALPDHRRNARAFRAMRAEIETDLARIQTIVEVQRD